MGRRIAIVASLRQVCRVCDGKGVLGLVQLLGFPAVGRVRCPHCSVEPGRHSIAIPVLPYRNDSRTA